MIGPCTPSSFVDVKFPSKPVLHQATWKDVRIGDILLNFADEANPHAPSQSIPQYTGRFVKACTFRFIQVSDHTSNI